MDQNVPNGTKGTEQNLIERWKWQSNMNRKTKIVYMGTPAFAADILSRLHDSGKVEIVAVYTNPDTIRSRGKKLVPSPVKELASKLGIPVKTPIKFAEDEVSYLKSLNPEFICVAAYGMILPDCILSIPKYECLNIHGSLLPRWRGAAPIQRAILSNDEYCGSSIMRVEHGMDTGDYCVQSKFKIADLTLDEIEQNISKCGTEDLLNAIEKILSGKIKWTKQNEAEVTIAKKLGKRELWLNPSDDVFDAKRKVQASSNAHSSKCCIAGKNVTIIKAQTSLFEKAKKGTVVFENKKLYLGFANGALEILKLKPDGKNVMEAKAFALGMQNIKNGDINWEKID